MNLPGPISDALLFTHEAMNTTFSLRLRGVEQSAAQDMAKACFDQIDLLESKLSRYVDDSEVSQINRMTAGQTLYLSESTHQCLLLGLDAYARTGGLFDITLGRDIEHWKTGGEGPLPPPAGRLVIHPDIAAITCEEAGRQVDLGGIGKGFALDQLKQLLADWDAEDFLLAAGASSLLASGPSVWPVELAGDRESAGISLANQSLSASGTGIQGSHIVHPGGLNAMPSSACSRIWVTAATATLAEVWSTALMLVDVGEIADFAASDDEITSVHIDCAGRIQTIR
jgi:thiamine biosynthesis lipoprotein